MTPTDKSSPQAAQPIGALLKKRREQLKLSLARVEITTKIRGKYLVWIESSDFTELPNDIYTRGFVSKYAEFLGLDSEAVLAQYAIERGAVDKTSVAAPKPVRGRRLIVTPKILIAGILVIVVGLTLAYLGWQFSALAAPPQLQLNSPQDGLTIEGGVITVAGHVSEGADVFINDSPILTDANGNFSNKLALQEGVNQIKVMAKNKLGKATTFNRNILAHLPLTSAQTTLPTAMFDGVAASITIKDQATSLTVQIDNNPSQTITMLPGTSRVFQATGKLEITTSNSQTTSVMITNSTVVSKDLGVVGKGGELKLEFAKDTNFQ